MVEAIVASLLPKLPDLLAIFGGLVVSPVMGIFKKLFGAESKTEDALSTLAQTRPEILSVFVDSIVKLKEADIKFFNRDVIGTISVYISSLRAAIRPVTVAFALVCLMLEGFEVVKLSDPIRLSFEAWVSSWMGDRFILK